MTYLPGRVPSHFMGTLFGTRAWWWQTQRCHFAAQQRLSNPSPNNLFLIRHFNQETNGCATLLIIRQWRYEQSIELASKSARSRPSQAQHCCASLHCSALHLSCWWMASPAKERDLQLQTRLSQYKPLASLIHFTNSDTLTLPFLHFGL